VIAATPAEQRRLLDLQRVDTEIRKLEHRRSHLPEQQALDVNAETLAKVATEYATAKEQLQRLAIQQKRHENEIATVETRRKSEEARKYSGQIRNEQQLEALNHELGSLRGRKSELEDALLEIMEQTEELESLVATLKERHAELTGQVAELTEARNHAASDIDADLARHAEERASVAKGLPEHVVEYYEDLRARKDGVGVAELRGRTCEGCRLELTAIELEDVHANSQTGLARCEQCGRILVPV
jgi:predicted  nucleic acid-binding Zn-ribbon protein